jgi:hypothetical protein
MQGTPGAMPDPHRDAPGGRALKCPDRGVEQGEDSLPGGVPVILRRPMQLSVPWALLAAVLSCADSSRTGPDQTPGAADPEEQNTASAAGDYARDFLTQDTFDSLVLEIDWIEGWSPSPTAVDELVAALDGLCRKPGGIQVVLDDAIPSPGRASWPVAEVSALESLHRDAYRDVETGTAVFYALYLDAASDLDQGNSRVLGIAYHGSSVAIFAETIADVEPGVPLFAPIEDTVLVHEAGHLLGLVNNGIPMTADHQDEAHGAHDVDAECIMHWTIETQNVVDVLLSGKPDFDPACRADLTAAGGK